MREAEADMNLVSVILPLMNVIFFYAGWLICLWGAQAGKGWIGGVFTIAVLGFHFALSKNVKKDLLLLIIVTIMGTFLDSCYQNWDWIRYKSPNRLFPFMAPFWITSLYALLAINLDYSLRWLGSRPYLAALLGAWGVVSTYIAGEKIGAAEFLSEWTIRYIGVIWIFFFPFLFWISRQLDRLFFIPQTTPTPKPQSIADNAEEERKGKRRD